MNPFYRCLLLAACVFSIVAPASAAWTEPADHKFTEKQLTQYISAAIEWNARLQSLTANLQKSHNAVEMSAASSRMDEQLNAIVVAHGLERPEFDWLAKQTSDARSAATALDQLKKSSDSLTQQSAGNAAKLAAAQKQLEACKAAQAGEYRLLTDDQRASAIKHATDDRQAAIDEVKQDTESLSAANDEALQHDADAAAATKAAEHPGIEMTGDDRANFITDKTNEAKSDLHAAAAARERVAETRTRIDADTARITADSLRALHPELPQTDAEKAALKSENDAAVNNAQAAIAEATANNAQIAALQSQLAQALRATTSQAPPENVDLLMKHKDEYARIWTPPTPDTTPAN